MSTDTPLPAIRRIEDVQVGEALPTLVKGPVTLQQLVRYAGASGDFNPLHTDPQVGEAIGVGGIIAHGMLIMGFIGQLISDYVGPTALRSFDVRFRGMTQLGDVITCTGTVTDISNIDGETRLIASVEATEDAVIQNTPDTQWNAMLEIHSSAPFRILREAARYIRERAKQEQAASGQIAPRKVVNVTSIAGVHGNPGQTSYGAAKAGVVGLTKTLAKEWGRYNVQVNCACFGFIETRLTAPKETAETLERDGQTIALDMPDQVRRKVLETIALGRPGTPQEAANAILFLASPLADYITGQVLEVTGGSDL